MAKKKGSGELPVSNTPLFAAKEKIDPINVADEIKNSFLDYSMSVIISRALPDARDGLKPSQRRILYAMHELNLQPDGPHHFALNTRRPLGPTLLRWSQITARGYTVLSVPYWEWCARAAAASAAAPAGAAAEAAAARAHHSQYGTDSTVYPLAVIWLHLRSVGPSGRLVLSAKWCGPSGCRLSSCIA